MSVLSEFPISVRAAARDLGRARQWYEERLDLLPDHEDPGGVWYRFGGETWLYLYATPSAGTAQNTIAGWEVKNMPKAANAPIRSSKRARQERRIVAAGVRGRAGRGRTRGKSRSRPAQATSTNIRWWPRAPSGAGSLT